MVACSDAAPTGGIFVADPTIQPERATALRLRALERLTGSADAAHPRANSAGALGVLLELASTPGKEAEALALLHELQVHQVELELQEEELRRSRAELESNLARYVRLYELAPMACFTLDAGTAIFELNLAAARLLGADRQAVLGRRLDQLLTPESGAALGAMLADARSGAAARTWTLHPANGSARHAWKARASVDAMSGRLLVAMVDDDSGAGSTR